MTLLYRSLYWLVIGGICVPLALGLGGVLLPAFGVNPSVGQDGFQFGNWVALAQSGEFWSGLWLSASTGMIATLLAYWFASSFVVRCYHLPWFQRCQSLITPILSIPHAAVTIGVLFLLAPSGWLLRWLSPWLTGFERPPNWLTVQDPYGIALIIALVIKEMPYLIFAILAALPQLNPTAYINSARTLGYERCSAWHFVLLPRLYPLVRLPIFIVLAFNLTVVDVAMIIGPNTPSTLAVTLLRWFDDPSLSLRGLASSAALVLALFVLLALFSWHRLQQVFERMRHVLSVSGRRRSALRWLSNVGYGGAWITLALTAFSLIVLPIWSFTRRWRFPDGLPSEWTWANYNRANGALFELIGQSFSIAFTSAAMALLLSLILLEYERLHPKQHISSRLLYAAILLPQVTLLFGIQVGLLYLDWNGTWWSVTGLHLIYVLPYLYLTLKAPYLSFDQAYLQQANRLRPTPLRNYVVIKLALLKAPLGAAFAIGFSVSMAQYLPTLMAGEGRITTLTTEAVARAAGGDRKLVSVLAMAQALLPLLFFYLALAWPRYWTPLRLAIRKRLC